MAPTVWTPRRKWLGNLIPALFWLPLGAVGLFKMIKKLEAFGPGLWFLIAATALGWLALNQFGLFENFKMKLQLQRILAAKKEFPDGDKFFVGFASPSYSSAIDAHEDVGYLFLLPDSLKFVSETRKVDLARADIKSVRFRTNVHSLLLLGRWVSVEGEIAGKPVRMSIEPRERRTLLQNRRFSKQLRARIQKWIDEKA